MTSTQPAEVFVRPAFLMGPGIRPLEVGGVLGLLLGTRTRSTTSDGAQPAQGLVLDDLGELLIGNLDTRAWSSIGVGLDPHAAGVLGDSSGEEKVADMLPGSSDQAAAPKAGQGSGFLILDADLVPEEDIGIVRRFLEPRPAWRLLILAQDLTSPQIRSLLGLPRSSALAWPPDLDQLAQLLSSGNDLPQPGPAEQQPPTSPEEEDPRPDSAALAGVPDEVDFLRDPPFPESRETPEIANTPAMAPDPRAALSAVVPERGPGVAFTELGGLVEELLAGDALTMADSPRYLFRSEGIYPVIGDRRDLSTSLSGLLGLARHAAGSRGVVSVLVGPLADGHGVLLRVDFPPGSLGESGMEELLQRAADGPRDPSDVFGRALGDAARAAAQLRDLGAEPSLSGLEDGRLRLAVEFPPLPAHLRSEITPRSRPTGGQVDVPASAIRSDQEPGASPQLDPDFR